MRTNILKSTSTFRGLGAVVVATVLMATLLSSCGYGYRSGYHYRDNPRYYGYNARRPTVRIVPPPIYVRPPRIVVRGGRDNYRSNGRNAGRGGHRRHR